MKINVRGYERVPHVFAASRWLTRPVWLQEHGLQEHGGI